MKKYEQHPLSAIFPPLGEEEFMSLIEDINANGLRDPIVVYGGKILDGWHRYSACMELNVKNPRMVEYEGNDPIGLVLTKNFHRRHLTPSQRAFAIVELTQYAETKGVTGDSLRWAKVGSIDPSEGGSIDPAPSISQSSKATGVGTATIKRARAATKAAPEVKDAVRSGKMGVHAAAKLAKKPVKEQRAAAKAATKGERQPAKPRDEMVPLSQYKALQEKFDEMASNYDVIASELAACEAIRNGDQAKELKKLHEQLRSMTAARDQWQTKCAELTRQLKYATKKEKK